MDAKESLIDNNEKAVYRYPLLNNGSPNGLQKEIDDLKIEIEYLKRRLARLEEINEV